MNCTFSKVIEQIFIAFLNLFCNPILRLFEQIRELITLILMSFIAPRLDCIFRNDLFGNHSV